ncbi:MAG: tryptophan synthase subunit alpha [Bacteroidota bacterium]
MNRIESLFANRDKGEKVMSLFLTAGYPTPDVTAELVIGCEAAGADLIELGIPFSDPLADGPTIQFSSSEAIRQGITMEKIFSIVEEIRSTSDIPLVLMGYINPVLSYGVASFCKRAAEAGVDGLILPDITLEEAELVEDEARKNGLAQIHLVAPNTGDERMEEIDRRSNGFVYCVSVTGVTGARDGDEVARSVEKFIDRVNTHVTRNPKMVGFGIKNYEDAQQISERADGFIVGSALIETIRTAWPEDGWQEKVYDFVHRLKYGTQT